ncbi:carboxylesterase/lipase family protein [Paraburkholderia bannensis]|uniref:carboxylesterase/lipase family protein n=1 Tax=Paraburkholderia bannensis TaxID=765414 RepID=UPI002AB217A9|nr:carboxylesterase family protein [Paraburkholderia bannensis]
MSQTTSAPELQVRTILGSVRGGGTDVRRFLGIPYAAPPVGELRWRSPQPHAGWLGVREAMHFAPDSYQDADPRLRGDARSEDCLYLNIWAPARVASETLPVMVWIHGNGYTRGSGSHVTYDGESLAARGVVVVTINYRLGLPGFLAHPLLTRESNHNSSGNYGIQDQIAALKWVRENIASFGGDPSRITVFGQSAGATCSALILASDLARGLVQQAILQSPGSVRPMATLSQAEEKGGLIGNDLVAMRKIPIEELHSMTGLLVPKARKLASPRGMGPIVDGWVVRHDDMGSLLAGAMPPIPMIVGTNANEGRLLTNRLSVRTPEALDSYLVDSFGEGANLPEAYRSISPEQVTVAFENVMGDTQFNYGAWTIARGVRALGGTVFQYLFTPPQPISGLKPTHDDELPYAFGTLEQGGLHAEPGVDQGYSECDWQVSALMGDAWVRFAKTGNPGGEGLNWPAQRGTSSVLVLDHYPQVSTMPREEDLRFLQRYFKHQEVPSRRHGK